jgi:hypothetical protein
MLEISITCWKLHLQRKQFSLSCKGTETFFKLQKSSFMSNQEQKNAFNQNQWQAKWNVSCHIHHTLFNVLLSLPTNKYLNIFNYTGLWWFFIKSPVVPKTYDKSFLKWWTNLCVWEQCSATLLCKDLIYIRIEKLTWNISNCNGCGQTLFCTAYWSHLPVLQICHQWHLFHRCMFCWQFFHQKEGLPMY